MQGERGILGRGVLLGSGVLGDGLERHADANEVLVSSVVTNSFKEHHAFTYTMEITGLGLGTP